VAEVGDQEVDVDRQPKNGEDEDDENEETGDAALTRPRSHRDEAGSLAVQVRQNQRRQGGDDAQRDDVSEREERGEDGTTEGLINKVAVVSTGLVDAMDRVGAEDWSVDEQHAGPDDCQRGDNARPLTKSGSARVMDDRHVAHGGDQHQRVHGDVGRRASCGDVMQVR